jgi:predicted pyridoxine 5'-phosphate oxidase superfamily flavin-nucleotide-binding protein
MTNGVIEKLSDLMEKVSYLIVATTDNKGLPHIASTSSFRLTSDESLVLTDWFCAITMANLKHNPSVAILVWNDARDVGYQIVGEVERIQELSILNGYLPEKTSTPVPQVEWELSVRIEEVLGFSNAAHSDEPL